MSFLTIQQTNDGVKLKIADLQFRPNTAELLQEGEKQLELTGILLASFKDYKIIITGHTAEWGTADSCIELSIERANKIAEYSLKRYLPITLSRLFFLKEPFLETLLVYSSTTF